MHSDFVRINGKKLHYLKWGKGPKLLLALHGYANSAVLFRELGPLLQDRYTIVAVDLPYHGGSQWEPGGVLLPEDVTGLAAHFRAAQQVDRFSLLGFSLGGRVALFLTGQRPEWIDQLILLAPDGLASGRLYRFVTRNWLGQMLFRHMLARPGLYLRIMDLLHRWHWIDTSRYRFVLHHLGTPEARRFLGNVWPALRFILPGRSKVQAVIRRYHIPVGLLMGSYDRVIPPQLGAAFARGLNEVHLQVLEKGHRLMDEETAALVASQLH